VLDDSLVSAAAAWMAKTSEITPAFGPVPEGIEASRRVGPEGAVFVLINFDAEKRTVPLPHGMRSLLEGRDVSEVELAQYGVAVLAEGKKP
jgi:hypothetical protein